MKSQTKERRRLALVLSGGGARGAYQAGVVKALAELCQAAEGGASSSFRIITGVSAGAINAAFLAANIEDFHATSCRLATFWEDIRLEDVFRTDLPSLSSIGWKWMSDVIGGGALNINRAQSLLDTSPLIEFLRKNIDFKKIEQNIQGGLLDALAVSATDYGTAENVTFVAAGSPFKPWHRARRISEKTMISLEHVCGSAAIPLFFSPVLVGDRYFGDGCLRNMAPLSPAIHLEADAIIVVGVQHAPHSPTDQVEPHLDRPPSIARILSVLLNSVMMDGTASDIERLKRINRTLSLIPEDKREEHTLRRIDCFEISPSQRLSDIAFQEFSRLPRAVRYLLRGLGSEDDTGDLVSYLLFDPNYCRRLVALGYKDGQQQKEQVLAFLRGAESESGEIP